MKNSYGSIKWFNKCRTIIIKYSVMYTHGHVDLGANIYLLARFTPRCYGLQVTGIHSNIFHDSLFLEYAGQPSGPANC